MNISSVSIWLDTNLEKLNYEGEDKLVDYLLGLKQVENVMNHTDILLTITAPNDSFTALEDLCIETKKLGVTKYNYLVSTKKYTNPD